MPLSPRDIEARIKAAGELRKSKGLDMTAGDLVEALAAAPVAPRPKTPWEAAGDALAELRSRRRSRWHRRAALPKEA